MTTTTTTNRLQAAMLALYGDLYGHMLGHAVTCLLGRVREWVPAARRKKQHPCEDCHVREEVRWACVESAVVWVVAVVSEMAVVGITPDNLGPERLSPPRFWLVEAALHLHEVPLDDEKEYKRVQKWLRREAARCSRA